MRKRAMLGVVAAVLWWPATADFQGWRAQQQADWEGHRQSQAQAFDDYLDVQWQAFERFKAHVADTTPKPSRPPVVRDAASGGTPRHPQPAALPDVQAWLLPASLPAWRIPPVDAHSAPADGVRRYYREALASQPPQLVAALVAHARGLAASDWTQWKVMQAAARHYHPDHPERQSLLTWLLMHQAGYAVRIGYDDEGFRLLLPVREKVYGAPWYRIGALTYYDFGEGGAGRLYSYPQGEAQRPLALAIREHPRLPESPRSVAWSAAAPAPIEVSASLAAFYADYPQLDLAHYFSVPMSDSLRRAVRAYWEQHSNADTLEAQLTTLLHWIQHMPYATDDEQFGRENYLLPDEIFLYGASDCEDRAMLFAHWAQALFGIRVAGLDYPGHVAVGLAVPGGGERWVHGGVRWRVADPTYVGAGLGMSVPQVAGITPVVLPVPRK